MPRSRLPPRRNQSSPCVSASLRQVGGHVRRRHAVLDLGVGDGAVLLPQMQPQLALVAEVQVAFLALKKRKVARRYLNVAIVRLVRVNLFMKRETAG